MKIIFSLIFSILFTRSTFAQISDPKKTINKQIIGEVKNSGSFVVQLYYNIVATDTLCTLIFRNAYNNSVVDIQSINFLNERNNLEELYNHLKSVFNDKNKKNKNYKQEFNLGDIEASVSNYRFIGTTSVKFSIATGYVILSEKDIDQLFGKNNTHSGKKEL